MDTIYALASAQGKAGVAVIRLSGPNARSAAEALCRAPLPARGMSLRVLRDAGGARLDEGLILTFPEGASFTGEEVAELQVHGSIAGISSVLAALGQQPGLRAADPGEFTRRALENGRLDLAQVEALADLIDAETEAQRRQAQSVLSGKLGVLAESWRKDLIRAAALIEATIDFADEDVPVDVTPEVRDLLSGVNVGLQSQGQGVRIAERIRTGFEVAIVGAPNVGKSTLLNALAGREAAITSEIAGTTRDVIEVRMDLLGLPVTILDTAGLRETQDAIEGIGVQRARDRAEAADIRVFLTEDVSTLEIVVMPGDIVLAPKADQRTDETPSVSGMTGQGVESLVARIGEELRGRAAGAGLATRARHKQAMDRASIALESAQRALDRGPETYEIVAEDIRVAVRSLESLVGRIDVEDYLDEIFSSFCLGK